MPNKVKDKYQAHAARYFMAFFFIVTLVVSGCARKEIVVPSLTLEPTREQLTGKFVWYDLFTPDMQITSTFYQELFGWTFTDTDTAYPGVKTINNSSPIANAVEITPRKKSSGESIWLGYISVPDVDKAVEQVKLQDGSIYKKPRDLAHRGRIAIVIDNQGAILGLVHSQDGDPSDQDDIQNNFIGSELWTTDLERAMSFYSPLAGYEVKIVYVGPDQKYHLLQRDNIPRAGVTKILWDDVKPNWIPYIAVNDLTETINKAETLGGKVLIGPPKEIPINPLAIIADPTGAVFGIQQIQTPSGGNKP